MEETNVQNEKKKGSPGLAPRVKRGLKLGPGRVVRRLHAKAMAPLQKQLHVPLRVFARRLAAGKMAWATPAQVELAVQWITGKGMVFKEDLS